MKDFNDFLNNGISDELLAAYIDGNTTESENQLIESFIKGDSMLSEAYEIAHDSVFFGSNFDWELHKGDFGHWELGLPHAVTEADIEQHMKFDVPEKLSLQHTDDPIVDVGTNLDDISNNDFATNDLNTNDY